MAVIKSIALEEHYESRAVHEDLRASGDGPVFPTHIMDRLADLHDARLKDMDDNGVAIQIISHGPAEGASGESIAAGNDELAAAIRQHPDRMAGFAHLPMANPQAAARELERCIKDLGFVGALIDSHSNGAFYDGKEYGVFWAKAQELDVPIYIHPNWPSEHMNEALYTGGSMATGSNESLGLGAFCFGWHAVTATSILRLLAGRVFETYPKLKVVIGHSGELLPYMFARINKATGLWRLERSFAEVMHNNIWITTSGMFDTHSLRCLLGVMPHERVMFSVDYPFSLNALGREYLERIEKEGVLNGDELKSFAYGNAWNLLLSARSK